ncbi:hypothetical protein ADL03_43885, partial [Nocardia sp. NRRL S-836]
MAGLEVADHVAAADQVAGWHCGGDRFVGGAEGAVVLEGDQGSGGYRACVDDCAVGCGQDRGARGGSEVDAA